ncbi:MAG TPA: TIM44-like domain-containing protein [Leptospiraceae bacterium]|nr:TIM44-like domain-containing protein [Leptospiraceae bacterium]
MILKASVLAVFIFSLYDLEARPGGGGGFSGGSRSSSSSSRSSSSSSSSRSSSSSTRELTPEEKLMNRARESKYQILDYSLKITVNPDSGFTVRENVLVSPEPEFPVFMHSIPRSSFEISSGASSSRDYSFSKIDVSGVPKLHSDSSEWEYINESAVNMQTFVLGSKDPQKTPENVKYSVEYNIYRGFSVEKDQMYFRFPIQPLHGKKDKLSSSVYEIKLPFSLKKGTKISFYKYGDKPKLLNENELKEDTDTVYGRLLVIPEKNDYFFISFPVPSEEFRTENFGEKFYESHGDTFRFSESLISADIHSDTSVKIKETCPALRSDLTFHKDLQMNMPGPDSSDTREVFYQNIQCRTSAECTGYIRKNKYISLTAQFLTSSKEGFHLEFDLYDSGIRKGENMIYVFRDAASGIPGGTFRKTVHRISLPSQIPVQEITVKSSRRDFPGTSKISYEGSTVIVTDYAVTGHTAQSIEIHIPKKYFSVKDFEKNAVTMNGKELEIRGGFFSFENLIGSLIILFSLLIGLIPFGIFLGPFIYIFIKMFSSRRSSAGSISSVSGVSGGVKNSSRSRSNGRDELISMDPDFSEDQFLDRVRDTAHQLTDAWLNENMKPVRSLVSGGVCTRFTVQLHLMKAEGIVNCMQDWQILKVNIRSVDVSTSYSTVHVRLEGKARDLNLSRSLTEEERKLKLKSEPQKLYTEIWSFVRGNSAKTREGFGYFSGNCPNCGAPAKSLTDTNKCSSCDAVFNSGEFDWVLSEITQTSVWEPNTYQSDKYRDILIKYNISVQMIEDRASVLFWKWIEAKNTGDAVSLARDMHHKFEGISKADSRAYQDVSVGSADLKELYESDGGLVSEILIKWSSPVSGYTETLMKMHLDPANYKKFGLAEHGCDSCGAPLPEADSRVCSYCQSEIPEKLKDWLLVSVS